MPTPARTSLDDIVRAGSDILDAHDVAGLTMQAVAERVGVRAPSLYKRVRSRDDLVRLIAAGISRDVGERLRTVVDRGSADPRIQLAELAHALRAYAHAHPERYRLLFTPASAAARPTPDDLAHSVTALLEVTGRLAGPARALEAARTVTAWATGFIGMEFAGAFQLGGDVDSAYDYGITRLAHALSIDPG